MRKLWRRRLKKYYRCVSMFLSIVWRPAWPPPEAGWFEAHWTYALDIKTAWEVSTGLWLDRF